jgi:hypothetical protein
MQTITFEIPTDDEIKHSRNPEELRHWADWLETYTAKIIEAIRIQADSVEIANNLTAAIQEKAKLQRLLGAKETAVKNWQREG